MFETYNVPAMYWRWRDFNYSTRRRINEFNIQNEAN